MNHPVPKALIAETLSHLKHSLMVFSPARQSVQWFLTGRNPHKLPPATGKTVTFRRYLPYD